jgi:hypothetical protein
MRVSYLNYLLPTCEVTELLIYRPCELPVLSCEELSTTADWVEGKVLIVEAILWYS